MIVLDFYHAKKRGEFITWYATLGCQLLYPLVLSFLAITNVPGHCEKGNTDEY